MAAHLAGDAVDAEARAIAREVLVASIRVRVRVRVRVGVRVDLAREVASTPRRPWPRAAHICRTLLSCDEPHPEPAPEP